MSLALSYQALAEHTSLFVCLATQSPRIYKASLLMSRKLCDVNDLFVLSSLNNKTNNRLRLVISWLDSVKKRE